MIAQGDIAKIRKAVDEFWVDLLAKENKHFYDMATGKEGGHQLSDKVDQLSTGIVQTRFPMKSGYQHKSGKICTRSMGDIWFKNSQSEWNPINVKTGLVGSEGQPNIVSLKRVMTNIIEHKIDSYYLLLIKFEIDKKRKMISHSVHLTDILDWLQLTGKDSVVTFNSGPGQTMLKAKKFYEYLSSDYAPEKLNVKTKMAHLMELFLEGERNLIRDRERDRKKFERVYEEFERDPVAFSIDVEKQQEFEIQ